MTIVSVYAENKPSAFGAASPGGLDDIAARKK